MSKRIHNILLEPGTDEAAFLSNEAAGMEVLNNFDLWDGMICMNLTDPEAEILRGVSFVIEVAPERDVIEHSYPSSTPRYESGTVTYRTRYNPSGGSNGADYTGMNMYLSSEFKGASGFAPPLGFFGDYQFSDTVKSNFLGEYVDIVAIEAGSPASGNAGHENHVDFQEFDSTTSKFVPMDWSTVSGALNSARNNQVTNNNTNWFSSHAIGVLSAAGGKYAGWGKKSTLRVIYLADGTSNAYYGVLQWHIDKAVNPATGVKNATVVTGAWGYSGVEHERFYKIDDINSLEVYDSAGNLSTINRPSGTGNAQTLSFTASASGFTNYQVSGTDRNGSVSGNDPTINMVVGDTISMTNNAVGSHPMYFKTASVTGTGSQVTGVTGAGTSSMSWTPTAAGTYYYICQYHSDMVGQIIVSESVPAGWGSDLTPFSNNLIIPRVIQDPVDNNDYWMISVPDQTRYSTFDTIMNQFNSYNGIYHFKSAGNNAHVAVNPNDPAWNNKINIDGNADGVLNTLDSDGDNQFSRVSTGSTLSYFVLRSEIDGGDNQFTIAACQQDETNRLMDDYSNRGPQIDFASYGAYTWTSYPSGVYSDGNWGYFSGTSCAAPVAAGCATVFLDWYFTQRGVYPSIAQLKALMIKHAKENLIGENLIDFSNIPSAGDISSTKLYNSSEVNRVKDGDSQNGGADLSELYGTPALRVHIPWGIRMGSGKYIAGGSEQTSEGRRPLSGRAWPRQKVSFSS
jgi:plastocyanin